jgi:hypothetical protein
VTNARGAGSKTDSVRVFEPALYYFAGGAEMSETAAKIHFSVVFIFEK